MAKTKEERLREVHERAMRAFDIVYSSQWDIRKKAVEARRFCDIPGAQWDDWLGDQFQNRPRFEVNKIARSVDRIYNEYRNNRITVDFRPKSESSDDEVAEILDDMYRSDEEESGAQEAYDLSFNDGSKGGYGGWRYHTEYEDAEDDDNERQCIRILPITDADTSLFFDADAKRYDKADAKRAWVITGMTRDAYVEEYGDTSVADFPTIPSDTKFDWVTPDQVFVAEYYEREEKYEKVFTFEGPTGETQKIRESELDEEIQAELDALGFVMVKSRKIETYRVRKYIMDGVRIIEDCGYIAGEHIPLVPYYGNRSIINGVEHAWGQVQRGRDSQQLYNMQVSVIGETAALSGLEKPIFTREQVTGLEHIWANDNIDRNPYALVNSLTDAQGNVIPSGPIAYTKPPQVAPAVAALLEISNRDIGDVTGNLDQAQQVMSNTSAQAVELVQSRLDMGVFGYMDNMAKSMRRGGEIWLSMRRAIESERRKVRTVGVDGTMGYKEIMVPAIDPETGKVMLKNDITSGKYDVTVDVGPSFTTKRDAVIRGLTSIMQYVEDPNERALLSGMAIMQMDGPGLSDLRAYKRKQLVAQGVIEPNEQEKEEMAAAQANQQPDANTVYLQSAAQKELALAQKAEADTLKSVAEAELTRAKVAETLANVDQKQLEQIMMVLDKVQQPGIAENNQPIAPNSAM